MIMKWFLVFGLLLALDQVLSRQIEIKRADNFDLFKETFGKVYEDRTEEIIRKNLYNYNKRFISKHNMRYYLGHETYKMELNHFSDMFVEEIAFHYFGFNSSLDNFTKHFGKTFIPPTHVFMASEVDWRKQGAVTPVKNQGKCGSCWAFSATGALEGQHFRKTGKLVSLSEQNLIDCPLTNFLTKGCRGGMTNGAFLYVQYNHGIDTEEFYPYEAEEKSCRFKKDSIGATETGFVDIPQDDEDALMKAVATIGPVSAGIDAYHVSFMSYSNGVYYEPECRPNYPNHAVLVVGYGVENGQKYWLVKNSWGENWGEGGYIKMARDKGSHCGIAYRASYPLV